MEFGSTQLIGVILIILGLYSLYTGGGIFWVILLVIGAYLLLKQFV